MLKNKKRRRSKRIIGIQIISSFAGLTAVATIPAAYFGYSAYKDKAAAIVNSKHAPTTGPWAAQQKPNDSNKVIEFKDITRNYNKGALINDDLSKDTFNNVKQDIISSGLNPEDPKDFNSYFFNDDTVSEKLTPEIFYDIVKANTLIYDHFSKKIFGDVQHLMEMTYSQLIKKNANGNYGEINTLSVSAKNIWYQSPTSFNFDISFNLNFYGDSAAIGQTEGELGIEFLPTNSSRLYIDDSGSVSLTRTMIKLHVHMKIDRLWTAYVYSNVDVRKPFSQNAPSPYNNFRSALLYSWLNNGKPYDTQQPIPGMPLFSPLYAIVNDPDNSKGYFNDYSDWFFEILLNYIHQPSAFDIPK